MKRNTQVKSNNKSYLLVACIISALILSVYVVSLKSGEFLEDFQSRSEKLKTYQDIYKRMGGFGSKQNTLLILANNAEIRTGGGFIGTVGMIETSEGKAETKPLVGVYSIDSGIGCDDKRFSQPSYLQKLSPCPSLRDSSNALDFTSNARQALYFYQQNTNIPVDNVVQITPRALELLLDMTGPVYLKDYDMTVTKDNFRNTVQLEVEQGIDKQLKNDPKSGVLGSLANQLISKLLVKDVYQLKDYIAILEQLIDEKQLTIYSKDDKTQALIRRVNADGSVKSTDGNYFMMAESNFSANKSSPYIKNKVVMHQTIEKDGTSILDVEIHSSHISDYQYSYIDPNNNAKAWLIGENNSRITLVLPKDSQILNTSLSPDEYTTSGDNKTIIEYDRYLRPLSKVSETLRYRIPTSYILSDKLIVNTIIQKQLGGWSYDLNYSLTIPNEEYNLVAANVDLVTQENQAPWTVHYSGSVDSDKLLSFIYARENN
ncbi:MAG TPA: DUF4012 domain-containing protein [Candidatus Saccharibacteria bacterium]|nr:DUF4012 domain-containing protein [Candidatus Saccharibacteria bacterium]HMT39545.1 DUF4012 domain-containing protein [Candidatus Saccharibacteria bacterium]